MYLYLIKKVKKREIMGKSNHNRYLGFERVRSQLEYEYEKSLPTTKQKNFLRV